MKRILFLLALILSVTNVMAQELTVKNFALDPTDLTASTQRRDDANGQACALVKVQLARPGAEFLGNVRGDTPYSNSVYMVYMMQGSKFLEVRLEGYLPVKVNFTDYGYKNGVESLSTYILSITLPNVVGQSVDDGKTYFSLTVTPHNAIVYVDDEVEPYPLDENGSMMTRLLRGNHRYRVVARGYETKIEDFVLGAERLSRSVKLESTMATLTVKCATAGADIYVNEEKRSGNSTWTGTLSPNSYIVEARKEGYYSQQQSVELSAKQNRTIELPALLARVGQLDVAYRPVDSEVWIDGKRVGLSPDVIKNLTVGSHRVEIRKEGYQSETKTVTIEEGQTSTLSGSLAATSSTSTSIASNVSTTANSSAVSGTTADKQTFTVNGVSFTMLRVEGGSFTMGATEEQGSDADRDEKPAHQVTLSTYSIGETEVTQELWEAVMGSNPSNFKGSKRPVEHVSWNDCQAFIEKLNAATGLSFRLPTEAEWEYAARGGNRSKGYKYAGSNDIESVAWYDMNSNRKGSSSPDYGTHEVATKRSNELGLYDMSGNVYEWCSDWYRKDYYNSSAHTNPKGPESGSDRVCRGGSWCSYARYCRSSGRNVPGYRDFILGFRLAFSE